MSRPSGPRALSQCQRTRFCMPSKSVQAHARAAVILTGVFAEVGDEGRAERISTAARAGGVRLIGPNCFGDQCPCRAERFDRNWAAHGRRRVVVHAERRLRHGCVLVLEGGGYRLRQGHRAGNNKADLNETRLSPISATIRDTGVIAMLSDLISQTVPGVSRGCARCYVSQTSGRAQFSVVTDSPRLGSREPYGRACWRLSDYSGSAAPGGSPAGRGRTGSARRCRSLGQSTAAVRQPHCDHHLFRRYWR